MKKSGFSIGPGAASLILVLVMLSMSVLAMLTLMSVRNDAVLAERAVTVAESAYGLCDRSERTLAQLKAQMERGETPDEAFTLEGNTVSWRETDGDRVLYCAVDTRTWQWTRHELTVEREETDEIWF